MKKSSKTIFSAEKQIGTFLRSLFDSYLFHSYLGLLVSEI